LNLKENVFATSSLISNPEKFHWFNKNSAIKSGLLLLFTKNGSDKFKVAIWRDCEAASNGINK